MTTATGAVLAGLGGAGVGPFLESVAYRLPRGEPLLGRAARPRARVRVALVAAVTALLCGLVVVVKGADADAWLALAFVLLLVPVTLIDVDFRVIPNPLMIVGAVVALALVLATDRDDLGEHLIACAAAGGFLLVAALAYPPGMGMGDVKLAGVMGLFLGRAVAPAMFVALLAGTVVGIVLMARRGTRAGRKSTLPFGPYLALGGLVGLYAGDDMVDWYTDSFG